MRRSLEKEKEAKGEGAAAQPLLAGTGHRDLDSELGVVTDGALARLLDGDGKDPEQEVLQQLAVKYEHGAFGALMAEWHRMLLSSTECRDSLWPAWRGGASVDWSCVHCFGHN